MIGDVTLVPDSEMTLKDDEVQYVFSRDIRKPGRIVRYPAYHRQERINRKLRAIRTERRQRRAIEKFWCKIQIIILKSIIKRAEAKR